MMNLPDFSHITDPTASELLHLFRKMLVSMQESQKELVEVVEELQQKNTHLEKLVFGQKSERSKSTTPKSEPKEKSEEEKAEARRKSQEKRRKNKEKRKNLAVKEFQHQVEEGQENCKHCGGEPKEPLEAPAVSLVYEYVPPQVLVHKHIREKKKCDCGRTIVTAEGQVRVGDHSHYGPGFHAHVIVSKCEDALPLHRQAKQFVRTGVSINDSTLGDMFHRSAELLKPIWQCLLEKISEARNVNADETRIQVQKKKKTRTAWVWTFISQMMIGFVYSPSRSGETPQRILKQSVGTLQVDGFTGYNKVCVPEKRERVGCWAHCRRKFFDALASEPLAQHGLDFIRELYEVEYYAAEQKVLESDRHLAMRLLRSQDIVDDFYKWVYEQQKIALPQSPMGKALTYAANQKVALCAFLSNASLKLDNNVAERALRSIAIGRKNFLFVGNDKAGEHLAILQSLTASCVACGVNPQEYLGDVLYRILDHPKSRIEELLPNNWTPLS